MKKPQPGAKLPALFFETASISFLFLLSALHAGAAEEAGPGGDLAVVGGRIYTAAGQVIEDGVVVIRAGKISEVGPRSAVTVPPDTSVLSAAGRVVIPGLVELWGEAPEASIDGGEIDHRSVDAIEPPGDRWRRVLAEGITTLGLAPAPVRGIGGLGVILKLRPGAFPPRRTFPLGPQGEASQGDGGWGPLRSLLLRADSHLVLALGVAPPGLGPPRITTSDRLEQYYALRQRFLSARQYQKTWNGYWEAVEKYNQELAPRRAVVLSLDEEKKPDEKKADEKKPDEKKPEEKKAEEKKAEEPKKPKPPERPGTDPQKEVLRAALERKLPVLIIAHSRADLGYAARLKEEFGLEAVVAGCTEGYRAAADLARAGVKAAVGPVLLDRRSLDLLEHRESNAAELARAGVPVAFSGLGGEAFPAVALRLEAAVAVRGGLASDLALRAITAEPAAALGVGDRVGTLAPGKDGDLVILDGCDLDSGPLSALARVVQVVVEGRVAYEREREL